MDSSICSRVLLTGLPGVGKTTVCKKLASILETQGRQVDGFYTEEVRGQNNSRIGFDIVLIKNKEKRMPLARLQNTLNQQQYSKYRVGNYHVFVDNFENIALPVMQSNVDVLLIDEIGKMELFSKKFHDDVLKLFFGSNNKQTFIIATIPQAKKVSQRFSSLFEKLYQDKGSKIIDVNKQNRDSLPNEIISTLL